MQKTLIILIAFLPVLCFGQTRSVVVDPTGDIVLDNPHSLLNWDDIPARLGLLAGSGRHALLARSTTSSGGVAIIGESQSGACAAKFVQDGPDGNPSPVVWIARKEDTTSTTPILVIKSNTTSPDQKILDVQDADGTTRFSVSADGTVYPSGGGGGGGGGSVTLTHGGTTYTLTLGDGPTPVLTLVPLP